MLFVQTVLRGLVVVLLHISQIYVLTLPLACEELGLVNKMPWLLHQPLDSRLCLHLLTVMADEVLVTHGAQGTKCRDSWR